MKLSFGLALALLTAMSVSAHPADPVAIREGEVSAGSTGAQLEVPAAYLATFKGKGFVDGEIEGDNGEYDEDYEDYEDDWEHDSPEKRQSGAAMRAAAKWMKISGVQVTQEELKRFGDDVAFGRVERNPKSIMGKAIKISNGKTNYNPSMSPAVKARLAKDAVGWGRLCGIETKGSCPAAVNTGTGTCIGVDARRCHAELQRAIEAMRQRTQAVNGGQGRDPSRPPSRQGSADGYATDSSTGSRKSSGSRGSGRGRNTGARRPNRQKTA